MGAIGENMGDFPGSTRAETQRAFSESKRKSFGWCALACAHELRWKADLNFHLGTDNAYTIGRGVEMEEKMSEQAVKAMLSMIP